MYVSVMLDCDCVPIFTARTENLQYTLRILQIFSTGSEYRKPISKFLSLSLEPL